MQWTPQQLDIYAWYEDRDPAKPHLVVQARAGSAKTTVALEGVRRIDPDKRVLLAAFNKHIAEELTSKLAAHHNRYVKTLHALGYQILQEKWGRLKVDNKRTKNLIYRIAGGGKYVWPLTQLATRIKDAVPWAKMPQEIIDAGQRLDVLIPEKEMSLHAQAEIVLSVMRDSLIPAQEVDFSDMVYIPFRQNWSPIDRYDYVIIDECQDLSQAQIELALRALGSNGKVMAVADIFQNIYAFRGAQGNSLELLRERLNAKSLPLTVSFRCSKSVIVEARKLVRDIQVLNNAPDGGVGHLPYKTMVDEITSICGDPNNRLSMFILSRFNAPLFPIALDLLDRHVPVKIQGNDYADRLTDLLKKLKPRDKKDLVLKLDLWEKQKVKLLGNSDDPEVLRQLAETKDCCKALRLVAERVAIDQIEVTIERLFASKTGVTCSTVHKIKGFEADIVFILTQTLVTENVQLQQFLKVDQTEQNIKYVAITRAKSELWWIDDFEFSFGPKADSD